MNADNLKVLQVAEPNKRLQMCKAIPMVETIFTILVDDDVIWPGTIIPPLLAPFEDPKVGAVGTFNVLNVSRAELFWNNVIIGLMLHISNVGTSKYRQHIILMAALHVCLEEHVQFGLGFYGLIISCWDSHGKMERL